MELLQRIVGLLWLYHERSLFVISCVAWTVIIIYPSFHSWLISQSSVEEQEQVMAGSNVDLILAAAQLMESNNNSDLIDNERYGLLQPPHNQEQVMICTETSSGGRMGSTHCTRMKKANGCTLSSAIADWSNCKHNENERRRRKMLKHSVHSLRDQLKKKTRRPALNSVLRAAYDEIQELKQVENEQSKHLEELKQQNIILNCFMEKLLKDINRKSSKRTTVSISGTPEPTAETKAKSDGQLSQQWTDNESLVSPPSGLCTPSPSPAPSSPPPLVSYPFTFMTAAPPFHSPYIYSPAAHPIIYRPILMPLQLTVPTFYTQHKDDNADVTDDSSTSSNSTFIQTAGKPISLLEEHEHIISHELNTAFYNTYPVTRAQDNCNTITTTFKQSNGIYKRDNDDNRLLSLYVGPKDKNITHGHGRHYNEFHHSYKHLATS